MGRAPEGVFQRTGMVAREAAGVKRPGMPGPPYDHRPVVRRQPAYLVCTTPAAPLEEVVQAYVWRWGAEANFRDEKQLMGIEEPQVRRADAVENVPAFLTATYALLLVSAVKAFGVGGVPSAIPLPKWRKNDKPRRASTASLINQLRYELWGKALGAEEGHFSGFMDEPSRETKPGNTSLTSPRASSMP